MMAVVEASPLLLPAALAGFSLVAMALLQLGEFRPLLVLPLGLAAAAVAAYGVGLRRPEPLDGPRWLDGAALAVSAARGGRGTPDLRLLADGALAMVLGGWVGLAVGRPTSASACRLGHVSAARFAICPASPPRQSFIPFLVPRPRLAPGPRAGSPSRTSRRAAHR
jgi:hypothetical protein